LIPNALSIAGVDPSGGAGILADVKAMSALGAYGCAVVAALTAQNTQGVAEVCPVPPLFVGQQIDALFADLRIDAVKIGMLGQQAVIQVVAEKLARWKPAHIVLDPVMVAKSGDLLLERPAVGALRETLLPQATLLTPNLPEAGVLLEERPVETVGNETIDLLHDGDRMIELPGHRIETANTHGTGCTLSAALAALLPQTGDVPEAARRAKAYLTEAIRHAERLSVGSGHGPVHHFHQWW